MSKLKNFIEKLTSLKCYALIHKDEKEKFLTIVENRLHAVEYANSLLKVEKMEHYSLWCKARNYNENDENVWYTYFNTCLTQEDKEKYRIVELKVKRKDVLAIMRMFAGCVPLGCSFDTKAEYNYVNSKLEEMNSKKEFLTKSLDELVKEFEKLMDKEENKEEADGTK